MTNRLWFGTLLLCLLAAPAFADPPPMSPPGGAEIPGRLIVRLQPGASLQAFIDQCESDHADLALGLHLIAGDASTSRYLLGFDPTGLDDDDLYALACDLNQGYLESLLCWGEFDLRADAPENFGGSTGDVWFYVGDAPLFGTQYAVQTLGLAAAQARSTGSGIVIAVLDTGVDASHPALGGRVLADGYNFVDGNTDTADVGDGLDDDGDGAIDELTGHGTFVASLVHLVAPEAWILPIRVLDSDGHGDSWAIAQAVAFAVGRGVEVINLSLGSTQYSQAVAEALVEATESGIIAVAAAGNYNSQQPELFPATYGDTLGIAAVDRADLKAAFSNYNPDLALSAPGASEHQGEDYVLDQSIVGALPGGLYAISEGTSFSTALVSGAAALIRAQHPEWPTASMILSDIVPAIADLLEDTSNPIDDLNPLYAGELGTGRLDASAAVLAGPAMPSPGDLDNNGSVSLDDLVILLGAWGAVHSSADLNGDGLVGVADVLILVSHWN